LKKLALAAAAGSVVLAAGLLLVLAPPTYQVSLNSRTIAAGHSLPQLEEALRAEAIRQAARQVTLTSEQGRWTYRLSDLGMQLPPEAVVAVFRRDVRALPWWRSLALNRPDVDVAVSPGWDMDRLAQALAPVKQTLDREPVPAKLSIVQKRPVITPETLGALVEPIAVREAVRRMGAAAEVPVPVIDKVPDATEASLQALRIKRLIAEWTTFYDPTIPRGENVEKAARAFNGLMLKPNQVLSYNETVGPIDTSTGWQPAPVIVGGELVPGVGGGVCQVATTFYGAALRANLDIVERHQHQLSVAYIQPSQDAAIAQGWEDLRLRNNTLGHLLIETESGGGTVTFRLYGDLPLDQEVKIESRVLGSIPVPTKTITDSALAPGQEIVRSAGAPGLESEAYRAVYKGGQLVKRELLSRDSYLPTARVVLTGPAAH
jgi:vancomycin resistance protein YoaR